MNQVRTKDSLAKESWRIFDWAGNEMFGGKTFKDFDDAEEFLSIKLGDDYETDRGEYEIMQSESRQDPRGSKRVAEAEKEWAIQDSAGNWAFQKGGYQGYGLLYGPVTTFKSFDDAEEFLIDKLGDKYEEERDEYEIVEI